MKLKLLCRNRTGINFKRNGSDHAKYYGSRADEPDTNVPRSRHQPHYASGQLQASQRGHKSGFRGHEPYALSGW